MNCLKHKVLLYNAISGDVMVETFGDIIIRILYTIINGIVGTSMSVIRDVILLFKTISLNMGSLSPLAIILAIIILFLLIFGLIMLFKGQLKPLIVAVGVLVIILTVLSLF